MLDALEFEERWREQGCVAGQENDVCLKGRRVIKRNNLVFHLSYADFFDRLALHHLLFPGAPPRLEGFVEHEGMLKPVFSQPAVRARRGASRQEVARLLARLGFTRVSHDDYSHPEGILVEDLHDENVFIDEDGQIVIIDPVIYLVGQRPKSKRPSSARGHPVHRSLSKNSGNPPANI